MPWSRALGAGGGQQARLADPAGALDRDHLARGGASTGECSVQLGQILFAFQQLWARPLGILNGWAAE